MHIEKTRAEQKWERSVKTYEEIPDIRKTASQENLRWFLRNGAVLIHKYPEAQQAIQFAQEALDGSR